MRWLPRVVRVCRSPAGFLAAAVAVSMATSAAAAAQSGTSPTPGNTEWNGWARCDLAVSGAGYTDRQSHLWIIPPAPPSVQGAIRVHAATWSVVGAGSLQRSQGAQTLNAQWKTEAQGVSAPIAFTVRASDGRLLIKSWHPQLRVKGAVSGSQQVTLDGKAQPPVTIGLEAFEWSFPSLEQAATATQISGSSAPPVTGSVAPMQPAGAQATASCSWQLARGPLAAPALATRARVAGARPVTAAPATSGVVQQPTAVAIGETPQQAGGGTTNPLPPPPPLCSPGSGAPPGTSGPVVIQTDRNGQPILPTSPEYCALTIRQRLDAVGEAMQGEEQRLTETVVASLERTFTSASACAQLAADLDAEFTSLILRTQQAFDDVLRWATTSEDKALVSKEAQIAIDALREQRERSLRELLQQCAKIR